MRVGSILFLYLGNQFYMKRYFLGIVFTAISALSYSQQLHLGLRGGVNQGNLTSYPALSNNGTTTSYHVGVFGRVGILGFYTQPEIMFNQRRGVAKDNTTGYTITNTLNYIDVPVLLGFKFLAARIYAGPSLMILAGANQTGEITLKDPDFAKSNYETTAFGFQAGLGADLGKITLDIRWDTNITNLGKTINTSSGSKNYDTNARMVQFSLGYKIF